MTSETLLQVALLHSHLPLSYVPCSVCCFTSAAQCSMCCFTSAALCGNYPSMGASSFQLPRAIHIVVWVISISALLSKHSRLPGCPNTGLLLEGAFVGQGLGLSAPTYGLGMPCVQGVAAFVALLSFHPLNRHSRITGLHSILSSRLLGSGGFAC